VAVGTPHSIVDLARSAIEAGAAVLTLCNTTPAMAIDIRTGRPRLGNTTGGLSGPAVHPIVVRLVHLVYRGVAREAGVPIVAAGGVMGWQSAAEFILAGASAVQVGAGSMASVRTPARVAAGVSRWARGRGAARLTGLVGSITLDG
jgi:dihydroorotate dehydrogenase (NAD+) catalytic subunit